MDRAVYVLARAGLAAKGTNYVLIGMVATAALFQAGQNATGRAGAWSAILNQPFGRLMLLGLALGFFCYAAWRVLTGTMDLEHRGRRLGGALIRFGSVVAGSSYLVLGASAARVALRGSQPPRDDAQARGAASTLLDQPFGVLLVGAVAIGFAIAGTALVVMVLNGGFAKRVELSRMSPAERRFAMRAGRLGTSTLAFLCFMTAAFFFFAAVTHDSSEAKGLAGALRTLAQQPFGPWLLGLAAAGFVAHGIFQFVQLRYLRRDVGQ